MFSKTGGVGDPIAEPPVTRQNPMNFAISRLGADGGSWRPIDAIRRAIVITRVFM
jgi:hypothetical protein